MDVVVHYPPFADVDDAELSTAEPAGPGNVCNISYPACCNHRRTVQDLCWA
jgi:hypothetical protein